jgi:2,3-bisphosphoglycerate-dependent phosphoglycerate mutase
MLYLLRHGETEWNRLRRRQGRGDSPLTLLGRRQAEACGFTLRKEITDRSGVVMHTSPLGRARTTAEIVRGCLGLPMERLSVEDCLVEHDYGEWQGMTSEEIDRRYPGARAERERNKWSYRVPGGESYAMLEQRLLAWTKSRGSEDAITIAVVHDMVSRVIRGIYLGLEPARTLALDHPHARIYCLSRRGVSAVDATVTPDPSYVHAP